MTLLCWIGIHKWGRWFYNSWFRNQWDERICSRCQKIQKRPIR